MTYDEGTVDTMEHALPVHEQFGFPGHVDVLAGQLGEKRHALARSLNNHVHMSADELKILLRKGWGVGNHSWSHYIHPAQPGLDLCREVVVHSYDALYVYYDDGKIDRFHGMTGIGRGTRCRCGTGGSTDQEA